MENENVYPIERLREMFNQMTNSRQKLRPILAEIADAIDKGFFVDADSEEVHSLLTKILDVQTVFSENESLKKAASSRKLEQINKSLTTLEQNSKRDALNETLERFNTLVLDSDDAAMNDAVKKVKLQVEHLRSKSFKMDMNYFAKTAERFVLLAEIIDNIENFSTEDYIKVVSNFADNPLLGMALTSKLIHFETLENSLPENLNISATGKFIETIQNEPNLLDIRNLSAKVRQLNLDTAIVEEGIENFEIQKAKVKKQITLKSFNNKLHEMNIPSDPSPIFHYLIKFKLFYKAALDEIPESIPQKLTFFIPRIFDKLFSWGMVYKVKWQEREFFYLNDFGLNICIRAFTRSSPPNFLSDNDELDNLVPSMQYFLLVLSEHKITGDMDMNISHFSHIPVSRFSVKTPKGSEHVALLFPLPLLGKSWRIEILHFKSIMNQELCSLRSTLKAVFVFAYSEEYVRWLKPFMTKDFKNVQFFMCTWNGIIKPNGKPIALPEEWVFLSGFGKDSANAEEREKFDGSLAVIEHAFKKYGLRKIPVEKFFEMIPEKVSVEKLPKVKDFGDAKETFEEKAAEDFSEHEETSEEIQDAEIVSENFFDAEVVSEETPKVEIVPEEIPEVEVREENVFVPTKAVAEVKEVSRGEDKNFEPVNLTDITKIFDENHISQGMLCLHALSENISDDDERKNWAEYLAKEVGFILDDPLVVKELHSFDTFSFWTNYMEIPESSIGNSFDYLNLAALIKSFYAPADPTSYQIQKSWKQLNEDKSNSALKACPAAKNLISLFYSFTEKTHRSFYACQNISEVGGKQTLEKAEIQIKNTENVIEGLLHTDVNHRRVKDLITQIFSVNGLLRKYFVNIEKQSSEEILNFCRRFEDKDLGKIFNDTDAVIDENIFSAEKIENFLDGIWEKPNIHLIFRKNESFLGPKRKKVFNVVSMSLTALFNYIHAKKNLASSSGSNQQPAPVGKARENLDVLSKQINRIIAKKANLGQVIFKIFSDNLAKKINGEKFGEFYEDCLLGSNYIELEENIPVVESFGVEDFSLKVRATDFIEGVKGKSFDDKVQIAYETALKNYDGGILEQLAEKFRPRLRTSDEDIKKKLAGISRQVNRQIERIYNDFLSDLELARNYARITDQEKIDFYINAAAEAKAHFSATKNAGLFQRFVNACNSSIEKASTPHKQALISRLEKLEENLGTTLSAEETLETRYPMIGQIRRQIDSMNLTVAEDYMNRLEEGGGNLLTELDVVGANLSTLEEFLREYEVLLNAILRANGSMEGAFNRQWRGRATRIIQDALDFLRGGWQGMQKDIHDTPDAPLMKILRHLGFEGGKVTAQNIKSMNQKSYTVHFPAPVKARESYPHPFAVFGTETFTKGLEVIYLGGRRTAENIAQVLSEMTTDRGVICLVDHALTLPERRSLAKIMKLTPNLKNILVIDKVVALYLARFDDANRGKKMLQTVLPFSRVQPYSTGGVVAPEMFIGRSEELDKIRDMTGPVFVYGGRQLGKSALLRQARNIEHNPRQLNYAFFIDLKNLDCDQVLKKIVYELQSAKLIGEIQTWEDFSLEMNKLLNGQINGVDKPNKLLLLLDESDSFLSKKESERVIDIMRKLLVTFSGQFKFVIAGLHKVIRFEQNSSFGNLNHISVLPFRPSDALELLVKPMSYLGFSIADDSLISAIFSRANYYPGLIQYYCKTLVEAVADNYTRQNFDVTKNPPYTLDDDYLKNMLGKSDFQEEINEKFRITLHLDDDNYYEILALAVAMVYYDNNRPVSVDISEIRDICLICGVEKITKLSDSELLTLLDEMVALNLLRRNEGKFEFNRYAFWHMMGTESEVNRKLDKYGINA